MDPSAAIKVSKYWMRVAVSLQLCLLQALLDLLHNRNNNSTYQGLPEDPAKLYVELSIFRKNKKNDLRKVVKDWQWDSLCPACCQTNSEKLDLTTIIVLITNLLNLPLPKGGKGWSTKKLKPGDTSLSSFVLKARTMRNTIFHCSSLTTLDKIKFEEYWESIRNILIGLDYQNIALFDGLKTASLDEYKHQQVSAMNTRLSVMEYEMDNMNQTFQCKKAKMECDIDSNAKEIQLLKDLREHQMTPSFSTASFTNVYIFNSSNSLEINDENIDIENLSTSLKKTMENRYRLVTQNAYLTRKTHVARENIVVDLNLKKSIQEAEGRGLTNSHCNIIISGEPGIGKSTLAETMVYHWSQNKVWNGMIEGDPEYKFVFILYFGKLNHHTDNKKITAKKILKMEFREVFDDIRLKTLRKMKEKVLLVLEGFDECCHIEDLSNTHQSSFVKAIYDLINPENSELPFKRILTSRPSSCSIIEDTFDRCCFRIYEINGLSEDNIDRYIKMYFSSNPEQVQRVHDKIKHSKLLSAIVHVPFYCWGVCCLVNDTHVGNIPETYTSLYAHLLLLFLRDHAQREHKRKRIQLVLESQTVQDIVLVIAELAFYTLVEKKITFKKEDLTTNGSKTCTETVELALKSGLLVKKDCEASEEIYTFLHATFHEFLAAIYILHNGLPVLHGKNVCGIDSTVLPLLAGLLGGLSQSSCSGELVKRYAEIFHHRSFEDGSIVCLLDQYLQIPGTNRSRMFLSCVYEYHSSFIYDRHVNLFGDFRNEFDYKRLCLEHLSQCLSIGDISIDNIVLFYDDSMWASIIPFIRKVSLHVMPSAESLLSSLPHSVLEAVQNKNLKLRKLKVLQNIGLDYIFQFIPFIESVELVGYVEDLRVLRFILSGMYQSSSQIAMRKLMFHLTEECDVTELTSLATFVPSFQVMVRGNSTTKVHECTGRCIRSSTVKYLKDLYEYVNLDTSSSTLGVLRNFHAGASCWFESEDLSYIYMITLDYTIQEFRHS